MAFIKADIPIFSNAKNFRMHDDVPLIVPTVNSRHMDLLVHQKVKFSTKKGYIVTNANCSTTGIVVPVAALLKNWSIGWINIVTLQAISGAGYPGISAIDIINNVIPYIYGEEQKIEI